MISRDAMRSCPVLLIIFIFVKVIGAYFCVLGSSSSFFFGGCCCCCTFC
jgi:hypothetical protein